jgi:hypothetical protein
MGQIGRGLWIVGAPIDVSRPQPENLLTTEHTEGTEENAKKISARMKDVAALEPIKEKL